MQSYILPTISYLKLMFCIFEKWTPVAYRNWHAHLFNLLRVVYVTHNQAKWHLSYQQSNIWYFQASCLAQHFRGLVQKQSHVLLTIQKGPVNTKSESLPGRQKTRGCTHLKEHKDSYEQSRLTTPSSTLSRLGVI